MKKLIIILSMLWGFAEAQQTIQYTPMTAAGYKFKYVLVDSGFHVPFIDTTTGRGSVRAGAIVCFSGDSLLYGWNGSRWYRLNAGQIVGDGSGIDSASFREGILCFWSEGTPTCYDLH